MDDKLEEVHALAGEYFDSEDTLERLGYIIPFPPGSELYTAFLDGYFYFTEAARDSRFEVMDEVGEDWQPDGAVMDAFVNQETSWRNRFFKRMKSSTEGTLPPRLYKFRRLATEEDVLRVTRDILLGTELWFPKASQMNDLFEFKMMLRNDLPAPGRLGMINFWDAAAHQLERVWVPKAVSLRLMKQMRKLIRKSGNLEQGFQKAWEVVTGMVETRLTRIRDELGVCCFAGNVRDPVLWAHYGSENQGVAFGFSSSSPFWSGLRRVQYEKKPPVFSNAVANLDDIMARAMITKYSAWRYEDEWRLIGQPSKKIDHAGRGPTRSRARHAYPKNDLVEVVFGARITDGNRQAIIEACTMAGLAPRFFQASPAAGYKPEIREYTAPEKRQAS